MQLFVFLTVWFPHPKEMLLEIPPSKGDMAICLELTGIEIPGQACSWFPTPGRGWHLPGVLSSQQISCPFGTGVPEPGKALRLPGRRTVEQPGSLFAMGGA